MDALVAIGLMVGLLAAIRWISMQVCPWGMRILERGVKRIVQTLWRCIWTIPVRNWGAMMTIWLWMVIAAVGMTVAAISGGGEQLPAAMVLWAVVFLAWLGKRWWAERQFRPRDLPTRRRWRRGR